MIEFKIDDSRLHEKLRKATGAIGIAINRGLTNGSDDLAKQIDDFMFVPLAFSPEVTERSNETTATINVNLNLPPRVAFRRTNFNRFKSFKKRKSKIGKRSWQEYVRQLGQDSGREMSATVATEIRRSLP